MDWEKIKKHAEQFNQLIDKKLTVDQVDEEVSHALAMMIYADARWVADAPKEQRQAMLERVHEICRDDVKDMAALIIKGKIP